jgi:hypothetical protein
MKKVLNVVLVLFILLFIHLLSRYLVNEIYISNYNNSKYDSKLVNYLFVINSPEPYVAHYNYGNNLYMQKNYKDAKEEFEKALNTAPLSKRCYVRYNLALSMLELVDYSNESKANSELEQIKKVLEGDNCANNQGTGDNSDSQNLHDDIEEYQNKSEDGESEKDEPNVDEEELKEKLDEQKDQAEEERNDMYDPNYSSYTGDKW